MPRDSVLDALEVRPGIARAFTEQVDAVLHDGTVPEMTKVLCAAMVSAINFCQPSVVEYRRRAAELGADADTLNALWDYARSDRFSDAQKAALGAAVALTREPRALPPAVRSELEAYYDEGEIAEILATIATFNALNRISNAFGTGITK
jgi:alkylhydroperoxidase family enzyme